MPPRWWTAFGTPWEPFDVWPEEETVTARFGPAWDFLMDLEGGAVMHEVAGDPGGRTRYGIAENMHPAEWSRGPPTEASARRFYRRQYWDPLMLGEIESQNVASEIFEFAVNATNGGTGHNVSVRTAQEAANDVRAVTGREHVSEDGIVGPQTLGALNALGVETVASLAWDGRFNLRQLRYYRSLRRELVDRFLKGWTRRVIA